MKLSFYAIILMAIFCSCSSDDENSCASPENVVVGEIDENFAFVGWDSNGVAEVVLGPKGFSPAGVAGRISFNGWASFGNLTPNKEYETYLQETCGDNTRSDLIGPYGFRTLPFGQGCTQPQSLAVIDVANTSVTISWDGMGQNLWQVAYGKSITNPSESDWENTDTTIFELTEIEPGVDYDIYVRANCGIFKFSKDATLFNVVLIEE